MARLPQARPGSHLGVLGRHRAWAGATSNLGAGKLKLEESQAAAAVGRIRLAHAYKELLDVHEITVAQILLTLGRYRAAPPLPERPRHLNTLLALGRRAGHQ